jgi:hypothetical protein|tara:strand:- start:116 stop:367 length:252 start_codon:yes stop_codon:yes gene_type:complete
MTNNATLKCDKQCDAKNWAVMPDWFVGFTTGGGSIGQVESRGLSKWGGAGSDFPAPFLSLDRFEGGWHNNEGGAVPLTTTKGT